MSVLKILEDVGIIPVVKLDNPNEAIPLADALRQGGINCAEITFRTDAAEESIRRITQHFPDMMVGAGTVLTKEQVDRAIDAGARFIVSPGINVKIVQYCQSRDIPIVPGCITPSEIESAIELGLDVVKFFPAEQAGGLAMIKAMCAPYTDIKFMPTGGITLNNLADYLAFNRIIACGGSFMVTKDLGMATEMSKKAVEIVKTVRNEKR